jgi:prolyl-tRNA synthetase
MSHSDDKGLVLPPPVAPVQVVVVPITKGSGAEHDAVMARVGAVVAALKVRCLALRCVALRCVPRVAPPRAQ